MGLMELTVIEMLQGGLSLIFVVISLILGLKIVSKYFEYKRIELLMVGLMMIFLVAPWWTPAISFATYVLFDFTLGTFIYFLCAFVFFAFAFIFWLYAFCHLVYPHLKKKLC